jgi:hypothetical protein
LNTPGEISLQLPVGTPKSRSSACIHECIIVQIRTRRCSNTNASIVNQQRAPARLYRTSERNARSSCEWAARSSTVCVCFDSRSQLTQVAPPLVNKTDRPAGPKESMLAPDKLEGGHLLFLPVEAVRLGQHSPWPRTRSTCCAASACAGGPALPTRWEGGGGRWPYDLQCRRLSCALPVVGCARDLMAPSDRVAATDRPTAPLPPCAAAERARSPAQVRRRFFED